MEIDFLVQETFALTRPQWKLVASFDEAGTAFADAVAQNYKADEVERALEPEEIDEGVSSEEGEVDDLAVPDMDEAASSGEEVEAEVSHG